VEADGTDTLPTRSPDREVYLVACCRAMPKSVGRNIGPDKLLPLGMQVRPRAVETQEPGGATSPLADVRIELVCWRGHGGSKGISTTIPDNAISCLRRRRSAVLAGRENRRHPEVSCGGRARKESHRGRESPGSTTLRGSSVRRGGRRGRGGG